MEILKVGDRVLWRGGFGAQVPREAVVAHMEVCEPGEKEGTEIGAMPWPLVASMVVVDLDNGSWAYGAQLEPLNAEKVVR